MNSVQFRWSLATYRRIPVPFGLTTKRLVEGGKIPRSKKNKIDQFVCVCCRQVRLQAFFCAKEAKLRVEKNSGFGQNSGYFDQNSGYFDWKWGYSDQNLVIQSKVRYIFAKIGGKSSENSGSKSPKLRVRNFLEFAQIPSYCTIKKPGILLQ